MFINCRAASDLIEELLDDKRYNSRARPQADSSTLSMFFRLHFDILLGDLPVVCARWVRST